MSTLIKKNTILLCFTLLSVISKAQFIDYGTDPARLRWSIVRTPNYNLLYPNGNDSMAYRYAVFLENTYPHVKKTIGEPKKTVFPVILHPTNMLANGMVAWAPRRMELITTPSPSLYAQSWDRQLVLHESRHVMQTGKLLQGVFKPLYYVIGEQAAGIPAFGVARWFFEGDAVGAETALSNTGRGRLPEFDMVYRAQMYSGNFTFDKWFLGSYRHFTGDFYALGYYMTSYARYAYGANVWDKVITRYAKRIYALPPFSNALKHYTGIRTKQLYNKTFTYLKDNWDEKDSLYREENALHPSQNTVDHLKYLSPYKKNYTTYNYPQAINDSTVVAVKWSLEDINELVMITNNHEQHLGYIGRINSRIVLNNNRVYWTEYVPGIRWEHENYSVIRYYDFNNQRIVTLTPRPARYTAPMVDSSGQRIAVSEYNVNGESRIVLVSTNNGKPIASYPVLQNAFVKDMVWANNNSIIVTAISDAGISFLQLDPNNGNWSGLMRPTLANITTPTLHDGKLFFESGLNGTNNIYYLDTLTLETYRVTSARFGAFNPAFSPNGKQLLFSDYQAEGYRLATLPSDSLKVEPADFRNPYRFELAETLAQQEQYNLDTANLNPVPFEPRPYRKGWHTFKIHSWAPFYYDVVEVMNMEADDLTSLIRPGATILSQNTLNSAIMQAGWYYSDRSHHGKLSFVYMGWFPVINLNVDYGGKAFDVVWGQNNHNLFPYLRPTNRTLAETQARIFIPFNFTHNHYLQGLQPSVTFNYTNNRYQQIESGDFRHFTYIMSELRYFYFRRLARRDILPRWGYQIRLQNLTVPFDNKNFGNLYAARLTTYVPGFIRNDGLMLRMAYQYQNVDNRAFYIPKQIIDSPRGHHYKVQTRQLVALRADYSFNILCPDYSIGSLAYVKRLRGNAFYDRSYNQPAKGYGWSVQSSYGIDLIFDWNAFRLDYPLAFGLRFIKPVEYGNLQIEGLFSIAFQ